MAAPDKRALLSALLLKKQTTIGTAVTPSNSTDGVRLQLANRSDNWVDTPKYNFDGSLGPSVGNLGQALRVAPSGKSLPAKAMLRAKGAGVAYSASVISDDMHVPLQIAGFTATLTSTAGSEKWVFTPTGDTSAYNVATAYYYADGELRQSLDTVADWSFDFSDQRPPIHTFSLIGIYNGNVSDVACPSVTYGHNSVVPPLAGQIALSIGGVTGLVVRKGSFALNRDLASERVPVSGSGTHLGVTPGGRDPRLKLTIERPALSTYSYETIFEAATTAAISLQFGSVQYNRWKIACAQAQLCSPPSLSRDGSVSLLDLEFQFPTSTPVAEDDLTITFD